MVHLTPRTKQGYCLVHSYNVNTFDLTGINPNNKLECLVGDFVCNTNTNQPKYNHFICDYMQLLVFYN